MIGDVRDEPVQNTPETGSRLARGDVMRPPARRPPSAQKKTAQRLKIAKVMNEAGLEIDDRACERILDALCDLQLALVVYSW